MKSKKEILPDNLFPIFGNHSVQEYILSLEAYKQENQTLFFDIVNNMKIAMLHGKKSSKDDIPGAIYKFAKEFNLEQINLSAKEMQRISDPHSHQGIVLFTPKAIFRQMEQKDLFSILDKHFSGNAQNPDGKKIRILILDGLSDIQNVAAIARTSLAFGVDYIVTGRESTFRITPSLFKISAGAISWINLVYTHNTKKFCQDLTRYPIPLLLTVADSNKQNINDFQQWDLLEKGFAMVIGNEQKGIRSSIRSLSPFQFYLPMLGPVKSINASHAATAFLAILNKFSKS